MIIMLLELRDLVGLDVRPRLFEPVGHDDLHQVVDGGLDFQVFTGKHVHFHLDVIMLVMNKIINRKRLVVGQIHQARLAPRPRWHVPRAAAAGNAASNAAGVGHIFR